MGKKGNINFTPSMYIVVYTYFLVKVTLTWLAPMRRTVPRRHTLCDVKSPPSVPKRLEKYGQRGRPLTTSTKFCLSLTTCLHLVEIWEGFHHFSKVKSATVDISNRTYLPRLVNVVKERSQRVMRTMQT